MGLLPLWDVLLSFSQVCVEIDLSVPMVDKFYLNNRWYNIEYEALHLLCAFDGCYGHTARASPNNSEDEKMASVEKEVVMAPIMIVFGVKVRVDENIP